MGPNSALRVSDLLEETTEQSAGGLESRVLEACRYGYARTLDDVLARRMRVLFLDTARAIQLAPQVAELMSQELNWSPEVKQKAIDDFLNMATPYLPNI